MDTLLNYEILDKKEKPLVKYLANRHLLLLRWKPYYKYYIQVRDYNYETNEFTYYILFGTTSFNPACKPLTWDDYGRFKIQLNANLEKEVINILQQNGNVSLEFVERTQDYDKYIVT